MQNVISKNLSYSVSDLITWDIFEVLTTQNNTTLNLTTVPTALNVQTVSGILKPLSNQSRLILEQSIGIQLTEDVYRLFLRDTNFDFKALKHIIKMNSHITNYGREMPIINDYFRVLSTSRRADSENWIIIYKLN